MSAVSKYFLFIFLFQASVAEAQKTALAPTPAESERSPRAVFIECLDEYKNFPKIIKDPQATDVEVLRQITKVDGNVLNLLNPEQLKARYSEFNSLFLAKRSGLAKIKKAYLKTKAYKESLPLVLDNPELSRVETRLGYEESEFNRASMQVYLLSLACNQSVLEYVTQDKASKKILDDKNQAAALNLAARKVLPGRYQGSRLDREKKAESEKLNLTPVDREFYETKLGKKLLADLGGQIDYWSYDYQQDVLYVQVGEEVAKVGVQMGPGGARYIRTRVGPNFDSQKPDASVDPNESGRFLTGDKSEETLFGKRPSKKPKFEDEVTRPKHPDGHDHGH